MTIIGIPLGLGAFKMAGAALVPFGRDVVDLRAAAERGLAADAIAIGKPPPG